MNRVDGDGTAPLVESGVWKFPELTADGEGGGGLRLAHAVLRHAGKGALVRSRRLLDPQHALVLIEPDVVPGHQGGRSRDCREPMGDWEKLVGHLSGVSRSCQLTETVPSLGDAGANCVLALATAVTGPG